jgi:hypothetical protein
MITIKKNSKYPVLIYCDEKLVDDILIWMKQYLSSYAESRIQQGFPSLMVIGRGIWVFVFALCLFSCGL